MKKSTAVVLLIVLVLVLDQILKVYVKLNIPYGSGFDILGWSKAKIHFVENDGMAFGFSFGGYYGKLFLSVFRIIMIGFLIYLLRELIKAKQPMGLVLSFGLIVAGAIGNMIDSAFYGVIFSESSFHHRDLATFMPENGGYSSFLHGNVVDMFYFPLVNTTWPEWMPIVGGNRFQFFKPVFNVADSAISVGVASILLFHRSFFKNDEAINKNSAEEMNSPSTNSTSVEEINPHTN